MLTFSCLSVQELAIKKFSDLTFLRVGYKPFLSEGVLPHSWEECCTDRTESWGWASWSSKLATWDTQIPCIRMLPANASREADDDGSSPWTPITPLGDPDEVLASGFCLTQPQLLMSSGSDPTHEKISATLPLKYKRINILKRLYTTANV